MNKKAVGFVIALGLILTIVVVALISPTVRTAQTPDTVPTADLAVNEVTEMPEEDVASDAIVAEEPQPTDTVPEVLVQVPAQGESNANLPQQETPAPMPTPRPTQSTTTIATPPPTPLPTQPAIAIPPTPIQPANTPVPAVPQQQVVQNQVVIRFAASTTAEERAAYIASLNGQVEQNIDALDSVVVSVPEDVATQPLPESPVIQASEPDYYIAALDGPPSNWSIPPNDPLYEQQWALPVIGAPQAWAEMPADAPTVRVAVIDSGVCASHPDLSGRIDSGWDFVEDDANPDDTFGHGCAVSGVIAANMNDGVGMAGVAPNAQVMPLRVLDGSGVGTYSDVAAAMVYAVDHGAQVINLSLGGPNPSSVLEDAVNYAVAHDVTVVAAAGNTGAEGVLYPAAYEPVVAVGAVDQDLERSSFSTYGPEIDLWAPGSDILVTNLDGGHHLMSGTSFAAPIASGTFLIPINSEKPFIVEESTPNTTRCENCSTPTPLPSPEPTGTLITEENYLYTDPVYGFELLIPQNWSIIPATNALGSVTTVFTSTYSTKIEIGMMSYSRPADVSLDEWVTPDTAVIEYLVSQTSIEVNNVTSVRQTFEKLGEVGQIIFIPSGSDVYFFSIVPLDGTYDETTSSFVEQTLQSFSPPITPQNASSRIERQSLYNPVVDSEAEVFANAPTGYRLPFEGEKLITAGPGCYYTHSGASSEAIDFGLSNNTRVLATNAGTIVYALYGYNDGFGNLLKIQHSDGNISWYAHLTSFAKTSGQLTTGEYAALSGDTGNVTGPHLHFEVRNSSNQSIWIRDLPGITWYSGDINNPCVDGNDGVATGPAENGGGNSCSAPSLSSPNDGYVSNSQTITFNWSAVSGCTFNGYTFRIKDTSDMDSGGTTIVDIGEGATSHTATIDSQWNNRDLYWGVRAANAPDGASWAVRRFRIEPGSSGSCSSSPSAVNLYDGTNCDGDFTTAGSPGLWSMASSFNDRAESIEIPSGWSVRLYKDDDEGSPDVCIHDTDSDLWNDYFSNNEVVANQPTMLRVYDNDDCTGQQSTSIQICKNTDGTDCMTLSSTGVYNLPDLGWNDQVNSVRVPSGQSIRVFRSDWLSGSSQCYNEDRLPLPSDENDLRGQVTSVQTFSSRDCPASQLQTVVMYNSTNYGGYQWGIRSVAGRYNMGQVESPPDIDSYNDKAESIVIPDGWSVLVYGDDNGYGTPSSCLSGSVNDLGDLKNQVSSIDIFHEPGCPNPPTGLSGHIYQADGVTPIEGAEVGLINLNTYAWTHWEYTDSSGYYEFDDLSEGAYIVWVVANGFVGENYDNQSHWSWSYMENASQVNITSGHITTGIDFQLDPAGTMAVTITDNSGTVLSDVNYELLYNSNGKSQSWFGAPGTMTFDELPPGEYRLKAWAPGYARDYYGDIEPYELITVTVGQTTSVTMALDPGGDISGTIYEADGVTPIAYMWGVEVRNEDGNYVDKVQTDGSGHYTVEGLPVGTYYVLAGGSDHAMTYYGDAYYRGTATPVTITGGQNTTGIDINLEQGVSFTGYVTDEGGNPIAGAWVMAEPNFPADYGAYYDVTDSNGYYDIFYGTMMPGDYRLVVDHADGYVTEYFEDALSRSNATTITTVPGSQIAIDFELALSGTISGHIYEADGVTPIANAGVVPYDITNSTWLDWQYTDSNGYYEFNDLAEGSYKVYTSTDNYVAEYYDDQSVWSGAYWTNATPVIVTAGQLTSGIDFALEAGGDIAVTVTDEGGTTLSSVSYTLTNASNWQSKTFNAGGVTTLENIPPGNYRLRVSASGYGAEYYNDTLSQNDATLITVTAGQTATIAMDLAPGGSISGTIYEADGVTPITNAWAVNVYTEDQDYITGVWIDGSGHYTLDSLPVGNYYVRANVDGYAGAYYGNAYAFENATLVTITAGQTTSGIDISLEPGVDFDGYVTDEGGSPIVDAFVCALPDLSNVPGYCDFTDTNGYYTISNMPPADYRLEVEADGYMAEYYENATWDTATILTASPGDTITTDFTLEAGGSISGTVYEPDGATPLAGAWVYAVASTTNNWVSSAQTDANGHYQLTDLANDSYKVYVWATDQGYVPNYYNNAGPIINDADLVAVTAPNSVTGIDFTMQIGGSISGTVTGSDGLTPLENILVFASAPDTQTIGACTDANGNYELNGLLFDTPFIVSAADGTCWEGPTGYTTEWWQNAYNEDTATPLTLTNGTPDMTGIDFALTLESELATIGNIVWEDANGDGQIEAAESAGLAGLTVNLLDSTGTQLLDTTVTDNDGLYHFNMEAGTYIIEFVAPADFNFTLQNQGDDTLDSDADPATGRTAPITVVANEMQITIDAGLQRKAQAEYDALVAFYNSTNGPNWVDHSGWLENSSVCTWYGVTCIDGHVTELHLPMNGLMGTLPTEIGDLTALTHLELYYNDLTGAIPISIGNLSNLQELALGDNQLSGTIPAGLGTLTNLQNLQLSANAFEGSLNWLTGLVNLQGMALSENNFSGAVPDLSNLTQLSQLFINNNALSGTLDWMTSLPALQVVAVSQNQFEGSLPTDIGSLSNLMVFYANDNALVGTIPASITGLNLSQLVLDHNGLVAENASVETFLSNLNPNWADTQTIPPTDVQASNITATSVDLSWTPITYTADDGYYRVSYSTTEGGPYDEVGCTTDNKNTAGCTVTDLTPGTTYYFVVQSFTPVHGDQQNGLLSVVSTEVTATTTSSGTVLTEGLHQQDADGISYSGDWRNGSFSAANGGTFTYSGDSTAEISFQFQGTGLTLYRITNPARGLINVCIDGTCQQVDNYSATTLWQQPVGIGGLTDTVHSVTISRVTGSYFDLDAVEVGPVVTALPEGYHEQDTYGINYTGTWSNATYSAASGGTFTYSSDTSAEISFQIDGPGFTLYRVLSPTRGLMNVCIDGTCQQVDNYSTTTRWQQPVPFGGLTNDIHTITISPVSGSYFDLDAVEVGPVVTALTEGYYEQDAAGIHFSGTWSNGTYGAASGGTFIYSSDSEAGINFQFEGTGLTLYRVMNPARGLINVCIDGTCQQVDNYSATTLWQQPIAFGGLANTTHSVTISMVSGSYFDLDAVEVGPVISALPEGYHEQDASAISYSGTWNTSSFSGASGASFTYSADTNAEISFQFEGTGVTLYRVLSPTRGIIQVCIDGDCQQVDNYSATTLWQQPIGFGGLADATHTVTISHVSGSYFDLDAVEVGPVAVTLSEGYYEQDSPGIALSGTWNNGSFSAASGGTFTYSNDTNAEITIQFQSTGITLYRILSPARGLIEVCIDDVCQQVDNYSAATLWQQPVGFGGLSDDVHSMTISMATGAYFDIDAIEVGPVSTTLTEGYYEQDAAGITRTGTWNSGSFSAASGGTFIYSSDSSAEISFEIEGTEFTIYRIMNPARDLIDVCIDDACQTINNYSAITLWQQPVTFDGLSNTTHSVTISMVTGSYFDLDAIRVGSDAAAAALITTASTEICMQDAAYWLTYTDPITTYDVTWEAIGTDGANTVFLWDATYADVLFMGQFGNAWYELGREYIAAQLNIASGATLPAGLGVTMDEAYSRLSQQPPLQTIVEMDSLVFQHLTSVLADFNGSTACVYTR